MNTNHLLIILFGILRVKIIHPTATTNVRSSNYERCYSVLNSRICYLRGSNQSHSWNDSRHVCDSINLSLPFFLNEDEDKAFKQYLEYLQTTQMANISVWSAGRRVAHDNWTWINDQIYTKLINLTENINGVENGSHVILTGNRSLIAQDPSTPSWYLCQYTDQCKKTVVSNVLRLRETCAQWNVIPQSWYEARNDCLRKKGDLVFLDNEDVQAFGSFAQKVDLYRSQYTYWLGLRKISWIWMPDFHRQPAQVTFTNWSDPEQYLSSGDLCIYLDASDGKWRTCDCSDAVSVICQRKEIVESSNTNASLETATQLQSGSIGTVIGVAVVLCFTSIAIAVFIVKRKPVETRRNRRTSIAGQYQDLEIVQNSAFPEVVEDYESIGLEEEHYENIADLFFMNASYESVHDTCDSNLPTACNLEVTPKDINDHNETKTKSGQENVYVNHQSID